MMNSLQLQYQEHSGVYRLMLDRPDKSNALNQELIQALREAIDDISHNDQARLLLISAAGKVFCAGADLEWMRASLDYDHQRNITDALELAKLLDSLYGLNIPVIACVNGPAFGGGVGLLCCCDTVIVSDISCFAFSELCLGLIPATILHYVIKAIGIRQARHLLLSAERFDAETAYRLGLAHKLSSSASLQQEVDGSINAYLRTAPLASRRLKQVLRSRHTLSPEELEATAQLLAEVRQTAEARQGIEAFLNQHTPPWQDTQEQAHD